VQRAKAKMERRRRRKKMSKPKRVEEDRTDRGEIINDFMFWIGLTAWSEFIKLSLGDGLLSNSEKPFTLSLRNTYLSKP